MQCGHLYGGDTQCYEIVEKEPLGVWLEERRLRLSVTAELSKKQKETYSRRRDNLAKDPYHRSERE
jgi:hypothetical protein